MALQNTFLLMFLFHSLLTIVKEKVKVNWNKVFALFWDFGPSFD